MKIGASGVLSVLVPYLGIIWISAGQREWWRNLAIAFLVALACFAGYCEGQSDANKDGRP